MFFCLYGMPNSAGASYKALVISDGPIAYWPLNELSGFTAVDVMANPANASFGITPPVWNATTILSPLLSAPYLPGNAYGTFDPNFTPNKFTFAHTDTMTVEAWVSTAYVSVGGDVISFNTNGGFRLAITAASNPRYEIVYNNVHIDFVNTRSETYQHVVCTVGPTGCKVYINGLLKYTNAIGWSGTTGTYCSLAGQYNTAFSEYLTGYLSNVAVYNKELTPVQVMNHFTVGGGRSYDALVLADQAVAYWPLGDTDPNIALDLVGTWGSSPHSLLPSANGLFINNPPGRAQIPVRQLSPSVGLSAVGPWYIESGFSTNQNPINFSYEIWFSTPYPGVIMGMSDTRDPTAALGFDRVLYVAANGQLAAGIYDSLIVGGIVTMQGGPDVRNSLDWHHAVFTCEDLGTGSVNLRLYLDGIQVTDLLNTTAPAHYGAGGSSPTYYLSLGRGREGSTWGINVSDNYHGSLSNAAYYSTVLTPTQVLNHYTVGNNNTGATVLDLEFNGNFSDSSAFNNAVTVTGSPVLGAAGPVLGTYAAQFSEGSYLGMPASLPLTPGNDFTLDFYVNFTSLPGTNQLCTWWEQQPAPALNVYYDGGVYTTHNIVVSDNNFNFIQYAWVPTVGQWYHIQVERRNAVMYLFIDEALAQANACSAIFNPTPVYVGGRPDLSSNGSMLGYISSYKLNNGQALVVPTAFTSDLVTQLNFAANNLIDSSPLALTWTPIGSPGFSNTNPSGTGNSLVTSQGNYISNAGSSALQFGENSFTVSLYVNFTALPNSSQLAMLFEQNVPHGLGFYFDGGFFNPANSLVVSDNTANYLVYHWVPNLGQWYYLTLIRDAANGFVKLYINDIQVASASLSPTLIFALGQTTIGGHPGLPSSGALNGRIADVTVINGQAIYPPAPTYQDIILADTPIAYWPMTDSANNIGSNGSFADLVSPPAPAYVSGPITFASTPVMSALGPAPHFPGNTWAEFSVSPTNSKFAFLPSDTVTFETWCILDGSSSYGYLFALDINGGFGLLDQPLINGLYTVYNQHSPGTVPFTYGQPAHVVCVIGPAGAKVYVNSVLVTTVAEAWSGVNAGTSLYLAGHTDNQGSQGITGSQSNAAIYKYGLTQAQITAHFQAGLDITLVHDPYWADVTALFKMEGPVGTETFLDSSTRQLTGPTGTANFSASTGVVLSSVQAKFGASSVVFPGTTNQFLSINGGSWFNLGLNNFTVEMFVYIAGNSPDHGSGPRAYVLVNRNNYSSGYDNLYILLSGGGGTTGHGVEAGYGNQDGTGYVMVSSPTTTVSQNAWHHLAVVRSNNTLTFYVDGVSVGTVDVTTRTFGDPTVPVMLGGVNNSPYDAPLNGFIDEFRVTQNIARYTANFTPPTFAFPNQ